MKHYTDLWWECETGFPRLSPTYSLREKFRREASLERFLGLLIGEASRYPTTAAGRSAARDRLTAGARGLAITALDLEERHLDVVQEHGFIEAALDFMQMARRFDPAIRGEDIYQASRNVWSMNLFQLLLGLPVQVTPAIFAYSMLYPYTDNYLDDPAFSPEDKRTFNQRFACRLLGQEVSPANGNEAKIFELVGLVEGQYDRARFPLVYESLLAIHQAQVKSLRLLSPGASPYEVDVLGIDFEKGGAATLADGYLVAGDLSAQAARVCLWLRGVHPADGRPGGPGEGPAGRPPDRFHPDRGRLEAGCARPTACSAWGPGSWTSWTASPSPPRPRPAS